MRGDPKNPEFRAKVIKLRKEGKKWDEVAKAVGVSLSAAKQYHGRKWYIEGMSAEKGKDILEKIKEKNDKEKETPIVKTPLEDKEKEKPQDVVGKTKDKAQKEVDKEIEKHIKSSDKKPKLGQIKKDVKDVEGVVKKAIPEPKSKGGGVWFLLAIIVAVVVIGIVFLVLRPRPEERAEYQKPTGEKKSHGFEDRSIEDL